MHAVLIRAFEATRGLRVPQNFIIGEPTAVVLKGTAASVVSP
jgi:hypothetical protein